MLQSGKWWIAAGAGGLLLAFAPFLAVDQALRFYVERQAQARLDGLASNALGLIETRLEQATTMLVDLVRRELPGASIASFAFRALRPTFAPNPFTVCGKPSEDGRTIELWAKDHDGYLTMRATATLA